MPSAPEQELRRARLATLVRDHFADNKAKAGRVLGLSAKQPGAYVGQLVRGDRPITEKTVAKIDGAAGGRYRGWLAPAPAALAPVALSDQERDAVADLRVLLPIERDEILSILRERAAKARAYRQAGPAPAERAGSVVVSPAMAARMDTAGGRAVMKLSHGDGNPDQGSLLTTIAGTDAFSAVPSAREADWYRTLPDASRSG